jgi:5S rRNA maturation endonuclease (ribonuclease M5)
MTAIELVGKIEGAKQTSSGWQSKCPAHEDKRASLSIAQGTKGIILKCHAGCTVDDICAGLKIKVRDLFPVRHAARPALPAFNGKPKIVATYDYADEKGKLLFQVVRFEPKDFRQRAPEKNAPDGWTWKTAGIRRVLFHLPQLISNLKADAQTPVFICEGEKDVLALERENCLATCNAGGAGKWLADYNVALLPAKRIIIIADKDEPGRKHARTVAAALAGDGRTVTVIEVPGDGNKDAADFLKNNAARELIELANAAKQIAPPVPTTAKAISVGSNDLPECFYNLQRGQFLIPANGEWIPLNDSRTAVHFKKLGFSEFTKDSLGVSVLESAMQRVVMEKNVSYAGAVAGYWPGAHEICGKRVLVTNAPRLIEPKPGKWETIQKLLEEYCADEEHSKQQWNLLHGWVLSAYQSLLDKTFRPALGLVLCGKGDSGKSFLQKNVIVPIMGGRTANPYAWLTGKTNFNEDLLAAECLTIDDEAREKGLTERQQFGQRMKQLLFAATVRYEGKGLKAFEARTLALMIACLNDSAQDLMILPPMDDSVAQKFLILKISPGEFPVDPRDFQKMRAQITAEIPAYLHWLTREFKLPKNLVNARTGVTHWHHPDLLFEIEDLHPWRRLMELIDHVSPWSLTAGKDAQYIDGANGEFWEGGVQDLHALLESSAPQRADAVLRSLQATGMDLKSAQHRLPARIGTRKKNGHTVWIIKAPTKG